MFGSLKTYKNQFQDYEKVLSDFLSKKEFKNTDEF